MLPRCIYVVPTSLSHPESSGPKVWGMAAVARLLVLDLVEHLPMPTRRGGVKLVE